MAIASPPKPKFATIADVYERVGKIPLDRILNYPSAGTATEEDVLFLDDHEDTLCELVDGILVRKPMGFEESRLAVLLGYYFEDYFTSNPIGISAGEAGMLRLAPGLVRIPDVSVILWDATQGDRIPEGRIPAIAPTLAVEVLSDSNTRSEMAKKLHEYFEAGTRLVWIIDPPTRTAKVYTSPERFQALAETETLDGGNVLPGFTLSIRTLFERASLQRKP